MGTLDPEKRESTDEVEAIRWSVRPYVKAPQKVWGVLLVAIVALLAGVLLFQEALLGLLGFAIILGATAEYWLGTTYKVDSNGANKRCGLSVSGIAWEDVKRVLVQADGVLLSPLAETGRMEPFRGVRLEFVDNKESVLQKIKGHVKEDVRFLEG